VNSGERDVQALIVVDMQAAFVSGSTGVPMAAELVITVKALLRAARGNGTLVVQLQNDGPQGALDEPGTPGWELFLPAGDGDGDTERVIGAEPGLPRPSAARRTCHLRHPGCRGAGGPRPACDGVASSRMGAGR
jgi:hypothetical protein